MKLGFIAGLLRNAGIHYAYLDFVPTNGEYPLTFWVGEYFEEPVLNEGGITTSEFTLTGTGFNSALPLETDKGIIEELFRHGQRAILENGNGIFVTYNNSQVIPSEEPTIKRLELSLHVKEWKVG